MIVNCIMFFVLMPLFSFLFFFAYFFSIPLIIVGIIGGFFFSKKVIQNQLTAIEKHGVYSTPRTFWLYLIIIVCVIVGVAIAASQVFAPFVLVGVVYASFLPSVPIFSIRRFIAYREWEQRNNRTLYYTTGIHGKIFPYPYMFESQAISTHKNDYESNRKVPS